MTDKVNHPAHYNQNGIEVIDVIETYANGDFRLANVIKYVCRCEYKGNKLQDLQKAAWYLTRVIEELTGQERDASVPYVHCEHLNDAETCPHCPHFEKTADLALQCPPDRIAGDDEAATRIKDKYYNFKRFEIQGYCAWCDKEIMKDEPYVVGHIESLKFCSHKCLVLCRAGGHLR